jgi:phage-related protein
MSAIPQGHIADALKLQADGKLHLFEVFPVSGGSIFCKADNPVTWLGLDYEGLPMQLSGEGKSNDGSTPTPRLQIGQEDMDLLPFKGLINDGWLDGATIVRKKVLLDDLLANRDIKETTTFRVKRVESYSRTKVTLLLATFSAAISQTVPFRQYTPPDFPWVDLN